MDMGGYEKDMFESVTGINPYLIKLGEKLVQASFLSPDIGLGFIAMGIAIGLACVGAGLAVAATGTGAIASTTEKPEMFARVLIFVGLAEGIAIYGLIVSLLIWISLPPLT
jgi:F0F1-type ATP synthase membrane subunit c/vacuolar-type H+-ATPase subunit K